MLGSLPGTTLSEVGHLQILRSSPTLCCHEEATCKRELDPRLVYALLREWMDPEVQASLSGQLSTTAVPLHVGLRQGGSDSALAFILAMDTALQPAIQKWNALKYGHLVPCAALVHHFLSWFWQRLQRHRPWTCIMIACVVLSGLVWKFSLTRQNSGTVRMFLCTHAADYLARIAIAPASLSLLLLSLSPWRGRSSHTQSASDRGPTFSGCVAYTHTHTSAAGSHAYMHALECTHAHRQRQVD